MMQGNSAGVLDCDTPGIWGKRHVAAPRLFGKLVQHVQGTFWSSQDVLAV